jgi:hypothetical protein
MLVPLRARLLRAACVGGPGWGEEGVSVSASAMVVDLTGTTRRSSRRSSKRLSRRAGERRLATCLSQEWWWCDLAACCVGARQVGRQEGPAGWRGRWRWRADSGQEAQGYGTRDDRVRGTTRQPAWVALGA